MWLIAESWEATVFLVKDRLLLGEVTKAVGYEPQRCPARWQMPGVKGALLADSHMALHNREQVAVGMLSRVALEA